MISVTESILESAIDDMLNTPVYTENMKQLITLIKDRPTPLLEVTFFKPGHFTTCFSGVYMYCILKGFPPFSAIFSWVRSPRNTKIKTAL